MAGNNPLLNAEITAEFQGFKKGFDESIKIAKTGSDAISGSLGNIDKSFKVVNSTRFTFGQNFKAEAAKITPAISGLTKNSNQAAFALTNLGRVAQDAPFGFIGIQNNLNPLLESFQALRATSGSNAAALKLLGQSLIGPAGLGLALSLVTSALTFFTLYMQKQKRETEEAKNINEDYAKSLDAVSRGLLKGSQDADRSLIPLGLLYRATQDLTLSEGERLKAVDELQRKFPKTFANLSDEAILAGKASTAYDELTKSIIAKAKASALEDELKDNAKLLRTLEKRGELTLQALKLAKQEDNVRLAGINRDADGLKAAKALNAEQNKGLDLLNLNNKERFNSEKTEEGTLLTAKDSFQLQTEALGIEREKNQALKIQETLTNSIFEIIKESGVDAIIDADKTATATKNLKSLSDILKELQTALNVNEGQQEANFYEKRALDLEDYQKAINSLIENGFKKEGKEVEALTQKYTDLFSLLYGRGGNLQSPTSQVLTGLAPTNIPIATVDFSKANTEIGAQLTEWKMKIQDFNNAASQILSQGISDAFGSLGESIGNSIANGSSFIETAGAALLGVIGGIATQLGKAAIKIGVGMIGIKAAFKNPLTAIAAGVALVALGSFISNKVSNITSGGDSSSGGNSYAKNVPRFASGVNNFAGGLAMVGENGPEFVNLPTGADVIPNGRSMDLIGKNQNINVVLGGEITADYRGLSIGLKRYNELTGRTT